MPVNRPAILWELALTAMERAGKLQSQFFRFAGQPAGDPIWEPPVELVEHDGRLLLTVALPGVRPAAIDLRLEGNILAILAERPLPHAFSGGKVHRLEIPYGRFERRLQLPPGPYQLVQRHAEDGCLLLVLQRLDHEIGCKAQ